MNYSFIEAGQGDSTIPSGPEKVHRAGFPQGLPDFGSRF
jgi:hypothetical protein